MALADARAMYPQIAVADADEQADLALLEAVADWCDRYTPLVGLDPPDGLTARHFRLRASVRRRGGAGARSRAAACGAGLQARVAVAGHGRLCVGGGALCGTPPEGQSVATAG